jgi:hypothetical protein
VIGVWLGTGVGGALIIDGPPAPGRHGERGRHRQLSPALGEHLQRVGAQGRARRRGEPASDRGEGGALAPATAPRRCARTRAPTWTTSRRATSRARSRNGDKAVEKLVRSRADVVGAALSNLVDFINPDVVVLGGGIVEAMPSLVRAEVRRSISAHSGAQGRAKAVKVVLAKLPATPAPSARPCSRTDMLNARRRSRCSRQPRGARAVVTMRTIAPCQSQSTTTGRSRTCNSIRTADRPRPRGWHQPRHRGDVIPDHSPYAEPRTLRALLLRRGPHAEGVGSRAPPRALPPTSARPGPRRKMGASLPSSIPAITLCDIARKHTAHPEAPSGCGWRTLGKYRAVADA